MDEKDLKLIVQIPCLNEEKTLPITVKEIPRQIEGIAKVEILVINDGSTDNTVEVAKRCGVEHIISFTSKKGLARAFEAGLDTSLKLGADIVVNTDADNQYRGEDIKKLVKPIIDGKADIVIGNRDIEKIKDFSFLKKKLQRIGSWVIRQVSGTDIPDATTGFRAYNKRAILGLNVISSFSYTLETIIAAAKKQMSIANVSIRTNKELRKSRLYHNTFQYIWKSIMTIVRIYTVYEPLRVFLTIGAILFSGGFLLGLRFLYFFIFKINPGGHIQSLILAAILLLLGFQIMVIGLMADLISSNRRLIEDTLLRIKEKEADLSRKNSK